MENIIKYIYNCEMNVKVLLLGIVLLTIGAWLSGGVIAAFFTSGIITFFIGLMWCIFKAMGV